MFILSKIYKNKVKWAAVIAALSFFIAYLFFQFEGIKSLDMALFKVYSSVLRKEALPHSKVKVIVLDDESYRSLETESISISEALSKVISFLRMGGARELYFDISHKINLEDFSKAVSTPQNLHFGMSFFREEDSIVPFFPQILSDKFSIETLFFKTLNYPFYNDYLLPQSSFLNLTKSLFVSSIQYTEYQESYRLPLLFRYQDRFYPSLPLSAVMNYLKVEKLVLRKNGDFLIGPYVVPVDGRGNVLVNWYPKGVESYSVKELLLAYDSIKFGEMETGTLSPKLFEDSIVLIGSSAIGLSELIQTPFSDFQSSAQIHATLISNILNQEVLKWVSSFWIVFLLCLGVVVTSFVLIYFDSFVFRLFPFLFVFLVLISSVYLFVFLNVFLPVSIVIIGTLFALFFVLLRLFYLNHLKIQIITSSFSSFFSPFVMQQLIQNYDQLSPEILKRKSLSILTLQSKNFPIEPASVSVKEYMSYLNEFREVVQESVFSHDGTLTFEGLGRVIAFFNAPIDQALYVNNSLKAAVDLLEKINLSHVKWVHSEYSKLSVNIGVHFGNAIVGNFGNINRVQYGATGESVLISSFLAQLCSVYGVSILISEEVQRQVQVDYASLIVDRVFFPGSKAPSLVYMPLNGLRIEEVNFWNDCMNLYFSQQFSEARLKFDFYLRRYKKESDLAHLYINRCVHFLKKPPPDSWDGVYY